MKQALLFITIITFLVACTEKKSAIENTSMSIDSYSKNQSIDYDNLIKHYRNLEKQYPHAKLIDYGKSDVGKPIYLFVIDNTEQFDFSRGQASLLINNGIHPGEPCGIDASINLATELLKDKSLTEHVLIGIIPIYNVGGSHNRGCCSRANQNGPEQYGFRGNARNLDLNRDFIKRYSKNAQVFSQIYHDMKPNLFVDTHASNGSDYQHVMTLITTQLNKLNPLLAEYTRNELEPFLFNEMEKKEYPMVPYVHSLGQHPESGIVDYLETPRYSTGYSTLFNTIGFVTETHMWKAYTERVNSTKEFLKSITEFANANSSKLVQLKSEADESTQDQNQFALNWELDTAQYKIINFKGFKAIHETSKLTNQDRYYYDREQPFDTTIKYYNTYAISQEITKPQYYVIPQAWKEVVERLDDNKIEYETLKKDTIINVESYYIEAFETVNNPYEGSYLHYNTMTRTEKQTIQFFSGDLLIPVTQNSNRYIIETLEPTAPDSYFNWGFFDEVLQQKEYFSAYIFEEKAIEILENNPELKLDFEEKKNSDTEFNSNHWAQLYFIYQHSKYYEKSHNRYPVYRINY